VRVGVEWQTGSRHPTVQRRTTSAWCQGDPGQIEAIIDVSTWERGCLLEVLVSSFTASPRPRIACCHAPRTEGHPEANPLLTPLPKRSVARAGREGKGLSAVAVAVAVTLSLAEATRRVAITKWHAPWRIIDPMQGGPPLKLEAQRDMSGDRTPRVAMRAAAVLDSKSNFCTPAKSPANVGPPVGGQWPHAGTQ
jgi:hypothetical protein